jgi:hypothetical protein
VAGFFVSDARLKRAKLLRSVARIALVATSSAATNDSMHPLPAANATYLTPHAFAALT